MYIPFLKEQKNIYKLSHMKSFASTSHQSDFTKPVKHYVTISTE